MAEQEQPEQKQPEPEQPEIDAKGVAIFAALIGIPILGIWLFPTVTAGILIFGSVLVFFLSVFRMAVPGIVLSVLMFVVVGALLPDSEPTTSDVRSEPSAAAELECADQIERLANYSFRWATGWFLGGRFPRYRWEDDDRRVATVFGDAIEFQNAFGAWQRHRYSCRVDGSVDPPRVLNVSAEPGRWPGP